MGRTLVQGMQLAVFLVFAPLVVLQVAHFCNAAPTCLQLRVTLL
jgi:hypothetical protein